LYSIFYHAALVVKVTVIGQKTRKAKNVSMNNYFYFNIFWV